MNNNHHLLNLLTPIENILQTFVGQSHSKELYDDVSNKIDFFLRTLLEYGNIYDYAVICNELNNETTTTDLLVDVAIKETADSEFVYIPYKLTTI
jgi:phage tail sheath protein FI